MLTPRMLKLRPSAGRLIFDRALAQAAVELRQDIAQLFEARGLGLGGGLTAEDDAEVVLEATVDGVLDAESRTPGVSLAEGTLPENGLWFPAASNWSSDCGTLSGEAPPLSCWAAAGTAKRGTAASDKFVEPA